ncbi:response regulator transcription factor [Streptomyces sp. NBC_00249]|uniref:response regulator transcription factor n=1 Tax=Streptomyces sp. NBC_00249 TaxID=2975690 RepID=UPI0022569B8E|nr:response regulator transcription factor [Streptomyces sp. NBC_00249]MCX5192872.1 response regulator transcription factor [Streptomyces sp. NBC_00249]
MREGLHTLLDALPDIDVLASTESQMETLQLARTQRPDVVLIGTSEVAAAVRLVRRLVDEARSPDAAPGSVVFHLRGDDQGVAELLRAGSRGLLNRDATSAQVIAATRAVASGRAAVGPDVVDSLVEWFRDGSAAPRPESGAEAGALTGRERQVLSLVGQGLSVDDIAGDLYIGASTVRTHLHRIRHKVGLRDRAQLVAFAYRTGLVRHVA